jgi:sugar phosphate permease
MRKTSLFLFAVLVVVSGLWVSCGVSPANGKLQVMFSGNIKGNVSPCG